MGVVEILSLVLGGGGIGSLVTWALHLRAEKRIKDAEANKSEEEYTKMLENDRKDRFEAMYVQLTKMVQDYNDLSDDYRAYRQNALIKERTFQKKIDDKCQVLAELQSLVQYLKGLRCYNTTCQLRIKNNPEKLK